MPLPATTGVAPAPIDLSGGLVPATGAASIDLSGGLVPKPEEPLISKIGDVGANFATGMVKGAGQTVEGVSSLLNKIPGVGEYLAPSEGVKALDQATQTQGVAQKLGAGAEGLLEFVAGDEALKGLSLAEKLDQAAKIAKFAETSPRVAKALQLGMDVMRGATVGGVEGGLKGGPTGAAEGAALGAGGVAAGKAIGAASEALRGTEGEPGLIQQIRQGKDVVQPQLKTTLQNPWASARAAASLRNTLDAPLADAINASNASYKAVDDLIGFDMKTADQELTDVNRAIKQEPDPDVEARLEARRKLLQDQIAEGEEKLGPAGMQKLQQARYSFMRSKALTDLQKSVFQNQAVVKGSVAQGEAETVNVDAAIRNLQKLQDNTKFGAPRLEMALGGDDAGAKAQSLLSDLRAARKAGITAMSRQQMARTIGRYIAHGIFWSTVGYGIFHHVLGEE
jgi:hypothetical protein